MTRELACVGIGVVAAAFSAHGQSVEIQSTHVAGSVRMLEGQGGNIGVSTGEDGVLMIDTQFAPLAPRIQAAIKEISGSDLVYVLNTHHHGDHTGGNKFFGRDAQVVAHQNARRRMLEADGATGDSLGIPVIAYSEEMLLRFNGEDIVIRHMPSGHTDGDSAIYFVNSNVAHLGDQFFNGRFPYIDLSSGGNALSYRNNVATLLDLLPDDVQIIPGHGPVGTKEDLRAFKRMLDVSIEVVQAAVDRGDTLSDAQAKGVGSDWDGWQWAFIDMDKWVEIVYNSIKKK